MRKKQNEEEDFLVKERQKKLEKSEYFTGLQKHISFPKLQTLPREATPYPNRCEKQL